MPVRSAGMEGLVGWLLTVNAFILPIILNFPYTLLELSKHNKFALPFEIFFLVVLILGESRFTNSKHINRANAISYADGLFVERYYETTQFGTSSGGKSEHLKGYYWIDVEKKVQDKLFSQIVERNTAYFYHYDLLHKEKYNTSAKWIISELTDERFEKLVIARGILEFEDTRLIFAKMEDEIICLDYSGEKDISVLAEELAKVLKKR